MGNRITEEREDRMTLRTEKDKETKGWRRQNERRTESKGMEEWERQKHKRTNRLSPY